MYQLVNYYCETDMDEDMVISFIGVQTDRISESSYENMSAHKKIN